MNYPEVAIIVIRDKQENFFVHRRNQDKKRFPGMYGLGAGGRIEEGELPLEGAKRELEEETGLQSSVRFLFDEMYEETELAYRIHVYETTLEQKPLPTDESEWDWSGWMSKAEVTKLSELGSLCPDTAQIFKTYQRQHMQVP